MNKKMLKRIYKTVSDFYLINKEVLSNEELKNLEEQKLALETELKKFWKR